MDRADSVEDIDFPHMQDKRDHHTKGRLATLVVPTSLQMGWVESPPYFCAATETSRDISTEYIETEVNSLHCHNFEHYIIGASEYTNLPESGQDPQGFWYMVEVYVDDFMS
jgi:hypothetical protein